MSLVTEIPLVRSDQHYECVSDVDWWCCRRGANSGLCQDWLAELSSIRGGQRLALSHGIRFALMRSVGCTGHWQPPGPQNDV
jgi:hypothetical protein